MAKVFRSSQRTLLLCVLAGHGGLTAQTPEFGEFFASDSPFHFSTVDGRKLGAAFPQRNLTPRGLVLRAGPRGYVCFDTELLRIAAVWIGAAGRGGGLQENSMAAGSYHVAGRKAPPGQSKLPQPVGVMLCATDPYPGWGRQANGTWLRDPRPPAPKPSEVGRGPLARERGRFESVELVGPQAVVVYRVAGVSMRESWSAAEAAPRILIRTLQIGPRPNSLRHVVAEFPSHEAVLAGSGLTVPAEGGRTFALVVESTGGTVRLERSGKHIAALHVAQGETPVTIRLAYGRGPGLEVADLRQALAHRSAASDTSQPPTRRWPETVTTRGVIDTAAVGRRAFAVDQLPLPMPNPWRRNVRAAGLDFLDADRAVLVTFDGDAWIVSGLDGDLAQLRWRRFAAGLHEPQSVCVIDGAILVFTRTGILRLRDRNGDGEADHYENFCNAFTQTAETREFALDMDRLPDGSLVIAKGGQQIGGASRHGGTILRIAKDGRSFTVLARGLREPFLGVHPKTGMVTASDQQGHWVPTTPVLRVHKGDDFGFRDNNRYLLQGERRLLTPKPTRPPLCWIPHAALKSASSQVWAVGAKLGPLSGRLLQLAYFDPGVFAVFGAAEPRPASVASVRLPISLRFAPLDARIHPSDGSLFVLGFRIWGSESTDVSGLARVRLTGVNMKIPVAAQVFEPGVLLRFDTPLAREAAVAAGNYVVQRWRYRRTHNYGSGHFRGDGKPGQEVLLVRGVHLSADRRAVFLRVAGMQPTMQMAVRYELPGGPRGEVYATVHEVRPVALDQLGFREPMVPAAIKAKSETRRASRAAGRKLFQALGCAACHSTDGTTAGKVGPSLQSIFGSERQLEGKKPRTRRATLDYLRRSILQPTADIAKGYQPAMPAYEGVLTPVQVESLLMFLRELE